MSPQSLNRPRTTIRAGEGGGVKYTADPHPYFQRAVVSGCFSFSFLFSAALSLAHWLSKYVGMHWCLAAIKRVFTFVGVHFHQCHGTVRLFSSSYTLKHWTAHGCTFTDTEWRFRWLHHSYIVPSVTAVALVPSDGWLLLLPAVKITAPTCSHLSHNFSSHS